MNETSDRLQSGREHLKAGRFSEAATAFRDITQHEPTNDEAWQLLGGALSQLQDWPAAVSAFRRAQELSPNTVRHYYNLAVALKEGLGRNDDARLYLERALELDPTHAPSRELLGKLAALAEAPMPMAPQAQQQLPLAEEVPLTAGRVALGFALGFLAGCVGMVLWYFISQALNMVGVIIAIGVGWLIGLATVKGCGQGGKTPARIAGGVTAFFLVPTCLFLGLVPLLGGSRDFWGLLVYGLCLYFGIQRAYFTALTAR
jgi:tetratricopeptide (TPR) repeat protein